MARLCTSFNQNSTCFARGTDKGFAVYDCDPTQSRFNRIDPEATKAGIGIIELLFKSNIIALVGGGDEPKYPKTKLVLWDDFRSTCLAEIDFSNEIKMVKMRRDVILVVLAGESYLYNFGELELIDTWETFDNNTGVCALTTGAELVVAVPGNVLGTVIVNNKTTGVEHIVPAHTNKISAIALSADGKRMATTSTRGTLIRVWDTDTGEKVKEFRRGLDVVEITSLEFDVTGTRLIVCSSKGTLHIFSLIEDNKKSNLEYISGYLPSYFSSEWSSVSFEVPPHSKCTFSTDDISTVYVITPDDLFLIYKYNTEEGTGECIKSTNIVEL